MYLTSFSIWFKTFEAHQNFQALYKNLISRWVKICNKEWWLRPISSVLTISSHFSFKSGSSSLDSCLDCQAWIGKWGERKRTGPNYKPIKVSLWSKVSWFSKHTQYEHLLHVRTYSKRTIEWDIISVIKKLQSGNEILLPVMHLRMTWLQSSVFWGLEDYFLLIILCLPSFCFSHFQNYLPLTFYLQNKIFWREVICQCL